ncbi:MAG: arginine N-succinyltransferase [Caulobacteraceae bacterium]|nr:arginine N-succinyltransferase [Caulobacteraceae bacterium]
MSPTAFIVRPARPDDLDALHALALQTGGGFTNLPPDRPALAQRLERSAECFTDKPDACAGASYILALEALDQGRVVGTATLFAEIGLEWPFYSYRRIRLNQTSVGLGRTRKSEVLTLVNDFDGCSEVGGLFLDPAWRRGGSGRLLARSRYLFIAQMRERFAERVVADLRGYQDEQGCSPFWDAVGHHFFEMPFDEADRLNSLTGNQFIADLMPKYPIYMQLLPPQAQVVVGRTHPAGEPAYRLLLEEGFRDDGYVDIFDAGPTVHAEIDSLRAVKDSRIATVAGFVEAEPAEGQTSLIATGRCAGFRAAIGRLSLDPVGGAHPSKALAEALDLKQGDLIRHVPF